MVAVSILGLIVAITLGLIISISISRQIKKVLVVAKALGENDLSKTVVMDTKDEIGILAKALNSAIINLKTLIGEISEIKKAIENVSATAEESVASSEEILASVTESVIAIQEITNASQNQARLAEKLNDMVQKFKL